MPGQPTSFSLEMRLQWEWCSLASTEPPPPPPAVPCSALRSRHGPYPQFHQWARPKGQASFTHICSWWQSVIYLRFHSSPHLVSRILCHLECCWKDSDFSSTSEHDLNVYTQTGRNQLECKHKEEEWAPSSYSGWLELKTGENSMPQWNWVEAVVREGRLQGWLINGIFPKLTRLSWGACWPVQHFVAWAQHQGSHIELLLWH